MLFCYFVCVTSATVQLKSMLYFAFMWLQVVLTRKIYDGTIRGC